MLKRLIKWLNAPAQIYVTCKMTGLFCDDMRKSADHITKVLQGYGLVVHHPIIKENIPNEHVKLKDRTPEEMKKLWDDDKKAIKWATVIFDTAAEVYSTGVKREFSKARGRDWSIIVTLWDKEHIPPYIAAFEDDTCVHSVEEAGAIIQKRWGTRWKRILWRIPVYTKGILDVSPYKIFRFWR